MAAPETQTEATLRDEGFRKAGVKEAQLAGDPDYAEALTTWMEEIKNDIQQEIGGQKLTPLQTVATLEVEKGISKIALPSNNISIMSMELLKGTQSYTATTGSSTANIILTSGHGLTTANSSGKEIYCYGSSTGPLNEIREINTISSDTITVSEVWSDAPDNGDTFTVIEEYKKLEGGHHIGMMDKSRGRFERGEPCEWYIRGDSDNGEFQLYPTPYWTQTVPYILRVWYYLDLEELDKDGGVSTLMATLYKRWRNIFVQGIYWRKLERLHKYDAKEREEAKYRRMIKNLINRHVYEHNLSDMQATVEA